MAQTPGVTHLTSPVRPPGNWANAPSEEDVQELGTLINLGRRTMGIAVENLEQLYFEKYAKTGLVDFQMPKLLYGPGAREAMIDGDLKLSLYNMRAVDAVALVAAAAGCRLEPIPAPPESPEDKKKPLRVVGYHVTLAMNSNPALMPEIKPVVQDMPPRSLTNITTLRPPLVRVVEPLVDTFVYSNIEAAPSPGLPGNFNDVPLPVPPAADPAMATPMLPGMTSAPSPLPSLPTRPFVRIYPVGFFIKGNENNEQYAEKHLSLEQLVKNALEQAKLDDKEEPVLSLHSATKILIVRASAAQHELIQQIITSLKENDQASAQGTAAPPR